MRATIYAHPRCSTCRSARAWLDAHALSCAVFDLTLAAPALATLREIHRLSGLSLRKLFNTSGQAYRVGDYSRRLPTMSDEDMFAALASDGLLVKRPIYTREDLVIVGFSPETYAEHLL